MAEGPIVSGGETPDEHALALVVRGGTFSGDGYRASYQNAGKVFEAFGRYGICVAFGAGMTLDQAIRSKPLRNPQLLTTTEERLRAAGWEVTAEPGSSKPFAGIVWIPDREPETFNRLTEAFDLVDSPYTKDERRDL